jgi:hypothetical protein
MGGSLPVRSRQALWNSGHAARNRGWPKPDRLLQSRKCGKADIEQAVEFALSRRETVVRRVDRRFWNLLFAGSDPGGA